MVILGRVRRVLGKERIVFGGDGATFTGEEIIFGCLLKLRKI
jgi:hypothetical protein